MKLINQEMKKLMEECKLRAMAAGLEIHGETLEYIITNQEFVELEAKNMIPSLYDYWVHDVEVVRNKWIYDVYPHNPFEVTINTRPAISFYNDNNPEWFNVVLFYHVLGHIDLCQNNIFFSKTWDDDFYGQALADKRLLNRIREERGAEKRWVDYVIEFARGIDNLVGYYAELEEDDRLQTGRAFGVSSRKVNFYFGEFLKKRYEEKKITLKFYYNEIERYNRFIEQFGENKGEEFFFGDSEFKSKFPEFEPIFKRRLEKKKKPNDLFQYLIEYSEFVNKEGNEWMKDVLGIVRRTSLFFQPMIRTKICHEGWASLWHERLFIEDLGKTPLYDIPTEVKQKIHDDGFESIYDLIKGHDIGFAKLHSSVLLDPRIGLNVYAIGKHLFEFIEGLAEKGKLSYEYQMLRDAEARRRFDKKLGKDFARSFLFTFRKNVDDALLVNFLSEEDFQDFVDKYQLFIAGLRVTEETFTQGLLDVYIKSKSGQEFRKMLNRYYLYHPPHISIREDKMNKGELYLDHTYESRILVNKYIPAVLIGLAYLWGKTVKLETTEWVATKEEKTGTLPNPKGLPGKPRVPQQVSEEERKRHYKMRRVLYECDGRKVARKLLS